MSNRVSIAVVDDHTLFRKGLISVVESIDPDYKVLIEASNGLELIKKLTSQVDIILLDVDMEGMDGFETAEYLKKNHPNIPVLVITMHENESTLLKMLKFGVKGFLSKDIDPDILGRAISEILTNGFYHTDFISGRLIKLVQNDGKLVTTEGMEIKESELQFLDLVCSELTYKQIAEEMNMSYKSVDKLRDSLFQRLDVKSRVGLALFAIKHSLVTL